MSSRYDNFTLSSFAVEFGDCAKTRRGVACEKRDFIACVWVYMSFLARCRHIAPLFFHVLC